MATIAGRATEEPQVAEPMADAPPYPGTPRWVKVFGIIAIVLVLFVLFAVLAGGGGPHGPGRHVSSGEAGGHTGWGRLTLLGVLVVAGVALNWGWLADRGVVPSRLRRFSIARRWPRWPRATRAPMTITPRFRKFVLVAHVTSSVGSLGAVAVFLALAVVGLTSQDAQMVRAAYVANGLIAWYIILPLILAALVIGVVQSLATPWGLFRHYWVLAKFLLTVLTIIVLLLQMDGIGHIAAVAAETTLSGADLLGLRRSLRLHAAGGLLVLLVLVALSIYKPRGMTRYGWRKQHAQGALAQP
jgi:hypothetical protein